MSETADSTSSADEPLTPHADPEAGGRRSQADPDAGDTPSDTIADSGIEGGVDEPNEGTDEDPEDDEMTAN
jgi:hypothetical protein